jgi:hypothetical protein
MATPQHLCAACGYTQLRAPQRSASGGASHEICPACGFEPGYTDDELELTPAAWKKEWLAAGAQWFSKGVPQPKDWSPPKKKATKKKSAKKATKAVKKTAKKAAPKKR